MKRPLLVLRDRDPALALVLKRLGPPPTWKRKPGFDTLAHIILEQQVSLASAAATLARLRQRCGGKRLSAKRLREMNRQDLRQCGVSHQKSRYLLQLAAEVSGRRFVIGQLSRMPDAEAITSLTQQTGIGLWTANVYLLMALRRDDILPVGDLALAKGMHEVDGGNYAEPEELTRRAEQWRPYRSWATKLIWSLYLDNRRP
ncbi:MAG: DNA-3-methyladenine glycosylase 2 family protein [Planctomycetota bacterium]